MKVNENMNKSIKLVALSAAAFTTLASTAAQAKKCGQYGVPAKISVMKCKVKNDALRARCNGGLDKDKCERYNKLALSEGAINKAGLAWLRKNGECAMPVMGEIQMVCPRGCFEASTSISIIEQTGETVEKPISSLSSDDRPLGLAVGSSLDQPELEGKTIEKMVAGEERKPLFKFTLSNGGELQVTTHHPMVTSDGAVIEAQYVRTGDTFLSMRGEPIQVDLIEHVTSDEPVYNFSVEGKNPLQHVVVAEGVLVGDLTLQNELAAEEEAIEIRG